MTMNKLWNISLLLCYNTDLKKLFCFPSNLAQHACFPQSKLNVIFKYYTSLFQEMQYLAEIRTFHKSYWSLFLRQSRKCLFGKMLFSFKSTKFPRTYKSSLWWSSKWDMVCLIYLKYISDCPIIFVLKKEF